MTGRRAHIYVIVREARQLAEVIASKKSIRRIIRWCHHFGSYFQWP
jgi:hypothetical protein